MSDIKAKLNRIRERFSDPAFLANKGLSNEVGIHVFCYDPADELIVREFTARLKSESGTPITSASATCTRFFFGFLRTGAC